MMRFNPGSLLRTLFIAGLLAGCDQLTEPPMENDPSYAILDGARGGDPRLFFLPPMVPAPTYSGTFDPTQSPVVHICELAGTGCGATIATFSSSQVQLQLPDQAYRVSWRTKGAGLNSEILHRIQVMVGGAVLGYADVWVLNNGMTIKTWDGTKVVASTNTGTLNIRFRIEKAAAPPPTTCTPGALGCGWKNGEVITFTQTSWGDGLAAGGMQLLANYDGVYASTFGFVDVGGLALGYSIFFTNSTAVFNYLPASGVPAPLNANLVDPTSSASGIFGGEVLGLRFNIDFSDKGYTLGTSAIRFGDLTLCGFTGPLAGLNGLSVRAYSDIVNTALGGSSTPYAITDLNATTLQVNGSFLDGVPSAFAQQHIFNGACDGSGWKHGELFSYSQTLWGESSLFGAPPLVAGYNTVYPGALIEIGLPAAAGYSILFSSENAVLSYLPTTGPANVLNADLVDPLSTASGVFGGEVLALRLNIDYSDAGLTPGSSPLRFGDVRLCGYSGSLTGLNGLTIREFSALANIALGGGTTPFVVQDLNQTAFDINNAFSYGIVGPFAQQHLVAGACP